MMDYEPSIYDEDDLADTLNYWFDTPSWRDGGHRFLHLGIDGTGSQVAAWVRPGHEPDATTPVVFFGSEGERTVLAASPLDWAFMIAHAPGLWGSFEPMASLREDEEDEFYEDEDEERPSQLLARYHELVENTHGEVPSFEELRGRASVLDEEFVTWVDGVQGA
jgi:hypothetical protein